ncbi:MAG TPA: PIN domain-containing protein [Dehalococcoidia bacterium]
MVDTSAVIYFLQGLQPYLKALMPLFDRVRDGQAIMFVSAITEAELLVRPHRTGDKEAIEKIEDFLSEDGIYVIEVTRPIARRAARLRPANSISIADAVIMATAVELGCDLLLGNDKRWKAVPDIPFLRLDDAV